MAQQTRCFAAGQSFVRVLLSTGRDNERRNGAATARLAIIAPSANSLVRFKASRYAFAEAQRQEEIETYLPR